MWNNPAILILLLAILLTFLQRFVDYINSPHKLKIKNAPFEKQISIIVILKPKEACSSIFRVAQKAKSVQRIKFNILKFLDTDESIPDVPFSIKHSVRLKVQPAANIRDIAQLRIDFMEKSYFGEDFICFLPHNADVCDRWDAKLIHMMEDLLAADPLAILTCMPPLVSFDDTGTFLRLKKHSDILQFDLESVKYKNATDHPCPSLIWSSEFSMFPAEVRHAFATKSDLNVEVEDALHSRHLWMNGFNFYTPSSTLIWKKAPLDKSLQKTQGKKSFSNPRGPSGSSRSELEYTSWVGYNKKSGFNKRAFLSVTPRATNTEYEVKYGEKENIEGFIREYKDLSA